MSSRDRVPDVLPFTKADLRLPMTLRKGQRKPDMVEMDRVVRPAEDRASHLTSLIFGSFLFLR